ncbi:MAG: hypothetical protein AAF996_13510 [Pseudomonadota bacterium]
MTIPDKWELIGLALVCRNDCIADSLGQVPAGMRAIMRGAAFQAELNACDALIMGRAAYDAKILRDDRVRIIVTRDSKALEHKEGGWWWNPEAMPLENMLKVVIPSGGRIAVRGGRQTLDYFLTNGLRRLNICRAESVAIMNGYKLLDGCDRKTTLDTVLRDRGLILAERQLIDLRAPVSLSRWTRRLV